MGREPMQSKKSIAWGKGFLRAWAAFSFLWVAAIILMTWSDFPTEDSYSYQIAPGENRYSISEVLAQARKLSASGNTTGADKLRSVVVEPALRLKTARDSAVRQSLVLAGSLPSILMMLGLLIAWVF